MTISVSRWLSTSYDAGARRRPVTPLVSRSYEDFYAYSYSKVFYAVSVLACVTFRLLAATDICGHADHSDLLALVLANEDRGLALGNGSARDLAINPKGGRVARYPATIKADLAT